jgi:hypothetical protein
MQWVYSRFDAAIHDALADIDGFAVDRLANALIELARALEARSRAESRGGATAETG